MPEYTDYIVNGIETLAEIAQKKLGYADAFRDLVLLNRLRYPYISDNPRDQLGKELARIPLSHSIQYGDHGFRIPVSDMVAYNIIGQQIAPGDTLFFSENSLNGDKISDLMYIESSVLNDDETFVEIIFDTEKIAAPIYSMQQYGLVYVANRNATSGQYAWPSELPLETSSPASTSQAGRYYFSYSYVDHSGAETFSSPIQMYFDSQYSAYKPEFISITEADIINGYQIILRSPSVFPNGVQSINVYVSRFDLTSAAPAIVPAQSLQATFAAPNLYRALTSLTISVQRPVQLRTNYSLARIGISHSYKLGSYVGFYDPPNSLRDVVLKSGDILKIPTSRSSVSGAIGTFATDSFTNTYGTDIGTDEYGQIAFSGRSTNDFTTVTGTVNVKQALGNRLRTYVGQMSTQPKYGNLALAKLGSSFSVSNLTKIQRMCAECVLSDPRVKKVGSIDVQYDFTSGAVIVSNFSIELAQIGSTITLSPITIGM